MKNINKWGGASAFYMALSYVINMLLFLVVLDYPSITDAAQKINLIVNQQNVLFLSNLVGYILFGVTLVVFLLALEFRMKIKASWVLKAGLIFGFIWAGSLIADGMIANAGMTTALTLNEQDPQQAALYWSAVETVANGLGNANGEILGGLMTLLISLAAWRSGQLSKAVNIIGVVVGLAGLISLVPALNSLTSLFGIGQIVWFVWVGIMLLRSPKSNEQEYSNESHSM